MKYYGRQVSLGRWLLLTVLELLLAICYSERLAAWWLDVLSRERWRPNVFYRRGYQVVDDEGARHRVWVAGFSGEVEPLWDRRWTKDNDVVWRRSQMFEWWRK